MTYQEAVRIVADKYNISYRKALLAYMSYYRLILNKIRAIPEKTTMTKEEFKTHKNSFSMQFLGTLYIPYAAYKAFVRNKAKHNET